MIRVANIREYAADNKTPTRLMIAIEGMTLNKPMNTVNSETKFKVDGNPRLLKEKRKKKKLHIGIIVEIPL
jgi:hypothetical protein